MKLGTESRVKTIVAVVLLVIAVGILAWQLWPSSGTTAAAPNPGLTRQQQEQLALQGAPVTARRPKANTVLTQTVDPRLRLDLLNAAANTRYEGKGRNIFRAEAEPAPEIPKPVISPITPNPQPQGPPPPPPINIKFFGFANRPGEPRQVFLSQNGDIFVAKEGDIVNRRYRIVHINPTSIEVEDVLSNNRQSIPLQAG